MTNLQKFIKKVEKGVDKFEEQGRYSFEDGGCFYIMYSASCKYHCVIGHMMPSDKVRKQAESLDETAISGIAKNIIVEYDPEFSHNLPELYDWLEKFICDDDGFIDDIRLLLLTKLQNIHDNGARVYADIKDCISEMRATIELFKEDFL